MVEDELKADPERYEFFRNVHRVGRRVYHELAPLRQRLEAENGIEIHPATTYLLKKVLTKADGIEQELDAITEFPEPFVRQWNQMLKEIICNIDYSTVNLSKQREYLPVVSLKLSELHIGELWKIALRADSIAEKLILRGRGVLQQGNESGMIQGIKEQSVLIRAKVEGFVAFNNAVAEMQLAGK